MFCYVATLNELTNNPAFFVFICSAFSVFVSCYKIATLALIMNKLVRLNIWLCDVLSIFITSNLVIRYKKSLTLKT